MDQEAAIEEITRWALADDNIRAVVLTGSVARGDQDDLSDVDVELYLRDPSDLLNRRDWYNRFGDLLAVEELPNPGWVPTRLLYLVDGKIDVAIGDLASFGVSRYSRPFRVLVEIRATPSREVQVASSNLQAHSRQDAPLIAQQPWHYSSEAGRCGPWWPSGRRSADAFMVNEDLEQADRCDAGTPVARLAARVLGHAAVCSVCGSIRWHNAALPGNRGGFAIASTGVSWAGIARP